MKQEVIICTDGIFPLSIGGMQRHSRLLIEHLIRNNNFELTIIHPHSENLFVGENVSEVKLRPIDISKNYLKECYKYSKRVYEVLQDRPNAIIYSQGLCVWYGIKNVKKRLIVNPHGLESFQSLSLKEKLIGLPFRIIFAYLFKRAFATISLGGKLTTILKRYSPNVIVIPNAVELSTQTVNRDWKKPLSVLFVGRFAYNKGIDTFMSVVSQLNKKGFTHEFHFNLIGKGPLFEEYKLKYQFDNVTFHGFVADEELRNHYQRADIFFFPTRFEGMPTVVLEAMAEKLPIIVSDVGASADLVDNKNGYLVREFRPEIFANSLLDFLNLSNDLKSNLSNNSHDKVTNKFTWEKVTKQHEGLFYSINL